MVAVSPDGRYVAYRAISDNVRQIFMRALDQQEASPVAGTQDAGQPFFSSDSQWLGFEVRGEIKKVPISGGAPVTLTPGAPLPPGLRFAWAGGWIVFSGLSGLQQLPDAGGTPQPLTRLGEGDAGLGHRDPTWIPEADAVLFSSYSGTAPAAGPVGLPRVSIHSRRTGERRNLIEGGASARYVPPGYLVYAQGGALFAVAFDTNRLDTAGTPVPVVNGVRQTNEYAFYDVSPTGTLVYVSGPALSGVGVAAAGPRQLVWVTRAGTEQPLAAATREYFQPRLSPDGGRVAVEIGPQIWIYDITRDALTRFTLEGEQNDSPVWTPDGKRIAVRSIRDRQSRIFWQLADGSGGAERLTSAPGVPQHISLDGQFLAFQQNDPKTQRDIAIVSLRDRKADVFIRTPATDVAPRFSPDGRWLAYVSDESGRPEVYVQSFPGSGGKWQISTEGGTEPVWNPNGRELFYRIARRFMVVPVTLEPTFSPGKPAILFEGDYIASEFPLTSPGYDVSRDGQRFLVVKEIEQPSAATQINVVLNWDQELKRLVPTR